MIISLIIYSIFFIIGIILGYLISSVKFKSLSRYGLTKKMYLTMMVFEINKKIEENIQADTPNSYHKAYDLDQEKRKLLKKIKKLTNERLPYMSTDRRKL
tara:strand:- start:2452 stop:2751 length:300 start_codon:yes stop_codon:yes gene_type:complete